MNIITRCEVCDSAELIPFIDLGDQPMCDDLVPIGSAAQPSAYPLRLVTCPRCITVHQAVQVEKKLLFPQTYHYRAALTADVVTGMRELVASIKQLVGDLRGKQVLDIGCNDGSLLGIFREQGANTAGIEPSGAASDAEARVDVVFNQFFDERAVQQYLAVCPPPDIITFTNVFAHIEDLDGVIENLKRLLQPHSKLVIENHYLGAVIARAQFDTFYHEHPRTYSLESFKHIARKLGRNIERVEFPARYNGNIRIVIGNGTAVSALDVDETGFVAQLGEMRGKIDTARQSIRATLEPLAEKYGPLPAKAFPGRAAILVHCFGLATDLIDVAYEQSKSPKVGHYIPGTRIEIRDEVEFFANRMAAPVLVNLAWHLDEEITRYMRSKSYRGEIIPVYR